MTHQVIKLFGVDFAALTERDVVDLVFRRSQEGAGGLIVTPNTSILRVTRNGGYLELLAEADLRVCDGTPIIWAGRLLGKRIPERVTGAALIWSLSERFATVKGRAFVLGGPPGAAAAAAERLMQAYPGLSNVGHYCPPFGFENDAFELSKIKSIVRESESQIVFVGLGFPKQEQLARQLIPLMSGTWFLGCGAAVNFVAGTHRRAPRWMQVTGLEWLHRLVSEPGRLGPRYAGDLIFLVQAAARKVVKTRRSGSRYTSS